MDREYQGGIIDEGALLKSAVIDEWRETDRGLQRTTTRLEAVLHEHHSLMGRLRERLGPVLLPEHPEVPVVARGDREVQCPTADRVEGLIEVAQATSLQIEDLLSRLDL